MVFFMVFIARGAVKTTDTMRGKLMLAWYQRFRNPAIVSRTYLPQLTAQM
jgi:hypothetical protein